MPRTRRVVFKGCSLLLEVSWSRPHPLAPPAAERGAGWGLGSSARASVSPRSAEAVRSVCVETVTWYINVEDGGTSLYHEMTFIPAALLCSEVRSGR